MSSAGGGIDHEGEQFRPLFAGDHTGVRGVTTDEDRAWRENGGLRGGGFLFGSGGGGRSRSGRFGGACTVGGGAVTVGGGAEGVSALPHPRTSRRASGRLRDSREDVIQAPRPTASWRTNCIFSCGESCLKGGGGPGSLVGRIRCTLQVMGSDWRASARGRPGWRCSEVTVWHPTARGRGVFLDCTDRNVCATSGCALWLGEGAGPGVDFSVSEH